MKACNRLRGCNDDKGGVALASGLAGKSPDDADFSNRSILELSG
jgi:hypothetical protein